jgi:hypothetical protein
MTSRVVEPAALALGGIRVVAWYLSDQPDAPASSPGKAEPYRWRLKCRAADGRCYSLTGPASDFAKLRDVIGSFLAAELDGRDLDS